MRRDYRNIYKLEKIKIKERKKLKFNKLFFFTLSKIEEK